MRIIGWLLLVLGGGHCLALGIQTVEMQSTGGNKNLPVIQVHNPTPDQHRLVQERNDRERGEQEAPFSPVH